MRKILLSLFLLTFCLTDMSAQWRVGLYGGADWCSRSIRYGYDYARTRTTVPGGVVGLTGQYNFLDWLGIRMDVHMQWRNFNDTYSVIKDKYRYRNTYLDIPLMASFSFGGKKLRGYANIGGYAGLWMSKDV
ncbi:MAG: outer membrane beta-barrel protein, partial [Alistipes sp.]|nr:outer membrane beta-barrel protein [Candidatus Minthomonas equi]